MDMRDNLLKDNLDKEQKKNCFYAKLVPATFRVSKDPNTVEKLVKEAERLGLGIEELSELEKTIKNNRMMKNKGILCHYLQVTKTQLSLKKILEEGKDR